MSEITDVLLARSRTPARLKKEAAEVAHISAHDDPAKHWPGFWVKHISTLDLANLYGILSERFDIDDVLSLDDEFELLHVEGCQSEEEGGTLVYSVPTALGDRLAELDEKALSGVARRWRKCEEFRGLYDQEGMEEVLRKFRDLAVMAKAKGRRMLLRM
ncbi:MAG: hypothetical protein L0Z62_07715 [Gemmataceae bacterium]|nr:hypothetical protein [Gemmataceae bacterium]